MLNDKYKLLIIDGHNLSYRCYYAVKHSRGEMLVNRDGVPITVCSGFIASLKKLLRIHNPTHLAIAFDCNEPTFRHKLYPEYKANRTPPEDIDNLTVDIRNLKIILKDRNISLFALSGYEADDVIATIVSNSRYSVGEIIISSSDKDLLQLVSNDQKTFVYHDLGAKTILYNNQKIVEEYGITSEQIADYKALVGDKSDNIPGVSGIGKISATYLLKTHNSISGIIKDLEDIKPSFKNKIQKGKDKMLLFQELTKLRTIPSNNFQWKLSDCSVKTHSKEVGIMEQELGVRFE